MDKIEHKHPVVAHFWAKMDPSVTDAITAARSDLWHGPFSADDREAMGLPREYHFEKAIEVISEWWSENASTVYYDRDVEDVLESEPEGYEDEETGEYVEPDLSNVVRYDGQDLRALLFGNELAKYVR